MAATFGAELENFATGNAISGADGEAAGQFMVQPPYANTSSATEVFVPSTLDQVRRSCVWSCVLPRPDHQHRMTYIIACSKMCLQICRTPLAIVSPARPAVPILGSCCSIAFVAYCSLLHYMTASKIVKCTFCVCLLLTQQHPVHINIHFESLTNVSCRLQPTFTTITAMPIQLTPTSFSLVPMTTSTLSA